MTSTTSLTPGRIRTLLRQRKLTQAAVARAANITEADMSRICARDMMPTDRQAVRILEVLEPPRDGVRAACTFVTDEDGEPVGLAVDGGAPK